jgi:hypothetical protein
MPVIDAHMHIQSNDIAPLPIMHGLLNKMASEIASGSIGTLIPILFKSDKEIKFSDISVKGNEPVNGWSLGNENTIFDRKGLTETVAGLGQAVTREYGKITMENSFHIACLYMDDVIQTNMGISSKKKFLVVNNRPVVQDNTQEESWKNRTDLVGKRKDTKSNFRTVAGHYYNESEYFTGGFEFSILLCMELLYAHYWGAYGIPVYMRHEGKLYYVSNNFPLVYYSESSSSYTPPHSGTNSKTEYAMSKTLHNAYDMPKRLFEANFKIDNSNSYIKNKDPRPVQNAASFKTSEVIEGREKYRHFLAPVDNLEIYQFEDYKKHLEYTRMAALKYPFRYLPFYHFDPRRFFADPAKIPGRHAFYKQKEEHGRSKNNSLTEINTNDLIGLLRGNSPFKYKMAVEDVWKELLETGDAGLFWGIKMYAALGCPPYLNNAARAKQVFPCLDDNAYEGLLKFYKDCAEKNIPVTCHGSPLGMTIADAGVYLKEYLKSKNRTGTERIDFSLGGKGFLMGLGLIDDFSSPDSWRQVLADLGSFADKFKLCLAHFGGLRYHDGTFDQKTPYNWVSDIALLIQQYKNIYTDISCFSFDRELPYHSFPGAFDTKNLISSILKYYQYNGSQYQIKSNVPSRQEDKRELSELVLKLVEQNPLVYGKFLETAKNLAAVIDRYPRLRYRILYGTDWPMSEMKTRGVPNYNANMFVLLQMVTKKLGCKWDAWHQFTVLNPLNFLGLLNDGDNTNLTEYTMNFSRLDKMKSNMENHVANSFTPGKLTEYKEKYLINGSELFSEGRKDSLIQAAYDSLTKRFKDQKIPSADRITENNALKLVRP